MTLGWLDTSILSFNSILLLERIQISWMPDWRLPEGELVLALRANPAVEWFMRHKCPEIAPWLDSLPGPDPAPADPARIRAAEQAVLARLEDFLVYTTDPAIYDAQPFLRWDDRELTGLVDFRGQMVIDVGAGTGRLALVAAQNGAAAVYAVEPVANLRDYLRVKAAKLGLHNLYVVDGLLTAIPFPDNFASVTLGGHVFGDDPHRELPELERVTQAGGMVILCPGNIDKDDLVNYFLSQGGYEHKPFEEPRDGWKRKYWRVLPLNKQDKPIPVDAISKRS